MKHTRVMSKTFFIDSVVHAERPVQLLQNNALREYSNYERILFTIFYGSQFIIIIY
jgi:hypothetical protein